MKRWRFSVVLSILAVFASGLVVGAFAHRLYTAKTVYTKEAAVPPRPKPEDWRKLYVKEMQTTLDLTETQLQQLNSILDTTRERFRHMRDRHKEEAEAMKEEQRGNVRAMLTAQQRPRYEQLIRERETRAKGDEKKRR